MHGSHVLLALLGIILLSVQSLTSVSAENGGTFGAVTVDKIIGIEELADHAGLQLGEGLIISEISWSKDGKYIVFDTTGTGTKNSIWMMNPLNTTDEIRKINFPSEQFSDMIGYELSDTGELLFAGIREHVGGNATESGLFNLYSFDIEDREITQITNYTGSISVVPFAFDWMPDHKVVYETRKLDYDPAGDVYHEFSSIWLTQAVGGGGTNATMLWNSTEDENGFSSLDASPDGKKLALVGRNGLSEFDVNERMLSVVEPIDDFAKKNGVATQGGPKWTDNSEFVVFWHTEYNQTEDAAGSRGNRPMVMETSLRVASADGSTNEVILPIPGPIPANELAPVAISPDGRFIAYAIFYQPEINTISEGGIFLVNLGSHVIPEFPSGVTVLASLAIVSIALLSRLKLMRSLFRCL